MLSLLQDLVELIEDFPTLVLIALEEAVNGIFDIVQLALEAANAVLPELPEVITPPSYIAEINWYYPVGTLLAVVTPLIIAYGAWLGVSWIYRKYGAM